MSSASAPIRIDRELDASAREVARTMSRSVSQQVNHWARLGRELERSPDVSAVQIEAVLTGQRSYDRLNAPEQAVVRTVWNEQIAERLAELDLSADFRKERHSYAELDEHGQLRIITSERDR